jgi:hypothetical protein
MDYLLIGQSMRLAHDADMFSLAFADKADTPRHYVLFRKSLAADAQDIRMGLDGLHLEIDDQSRSAYRAIARIDLREDRARLFLTARGQASLGFASVTIAFAGADLRAVFGPLACIANDEFPIQIVRD